MYSDGSILSWVNLCFSLLSLGLALAVLKSLCQTLMTDIMRGLQPKTLRSVISGSAVTVEKLSDWQRKSSASTKPTHPQSLRPQSKISDSG